MLYWIVYNVCYRHLKHLCAELISRLFNCFLCLWSLQLGCLGSAKLPSAFLWTPPLRRALGVCQPDFWEIKSSCQISFLPTEQAIRQLTGTLFINSCAFIRLIICWLSCASGNLHPQLTLFSGKPWHKEKQHKDVVWGSPASRWSGIAFQVRRWARVHVCSSQHRIQPSLSAVAATYPALKAGALARPPLPEQEAEPHFPEFRPNVFQCVNTPALQNSWFIRAVKQEM